MSAVGTIAKLAENVVGRTIHAVIHPVETLTDAAGFAAGTAGALVGRQRASSDTRPDLPAGMPDLPPPLPPIEGDAATGESFATEPKVAGPDETDAWQDELEEAPDLAVGEHPQPDTEPLMDPSLTKAIKSEAETLEKAADPNKG